MTASEACDAIGSTTSTPLRHMVRALSLHPWLNTPADQQRLKAAQWALRNWQRYQSECALRRDARRGRIAYVR